MERAEAVGPMSLASQDDVQVISLNALKRGADSNYHKLEIPVALAKP